MGEIGDRRNLPDLPLRDHRTDVDPEVRNVPRGVEIEDRDVFGRYTVRGHQGSTDPDKSVGDLQGGNWWGPATRKIGSWAFAFPAVVLDDEPETDPAPDATTTHSQGKTSGRRVMVLPIRYGDFGADARYGPKQVAVHPDSPRLSKGTPGIVLSGTEEGRQEDLFFPSAGPHALIAVNHAGDPEHSSKVYDLKDDNSLDEDRWAYLHTAWRVVNPKETCGLPTVQESGNLAWQLGVSGQDRISGHGLTTARAAGPLVEPAVDEAARRREEPPDPGGTRTRDTSSTTGNSPAGENPAPAPDTGGGGGGGGGSEAADIQKRIGEIGSRLQQIEFEIGSLVAAGGHNFSNFNTLGQIANRIGALNNEKYALQTELRQLQERLQAMAGTRTRDPAPSGGSTRTAGGVHACMGSAASGPLEVGGAADQHKLGTDVDGRPINAGHLSTGSLFYGGTGDAPLDFEAVKYTNPDPLPFRSPVHLRIDPEASHDWACGKGVGLWRWEAEVPFLTVDPPRQPPPPPPPHQPPPEDGGDPPPLPPPGDSRQPPPGGDPGVGFVSSGGRGGTAFYGPGGGNPGATTLMSLKGSGPNGRATRGNVTGTPGDAGWYGSSIYGVPSGIAGSVKSTMGSAAWSGLLQSGRVDSSGRITDFQVLTDDLGVTRDGKLGTEKGGDRCPTFPSTIKAGGGIGFVATPWAPKQPDATHGGPVPDEFPRYPTTAMIFPVGAGDGTSKGWDYQCGPESGMPTSKGGAVFLPPDAVYSYWRDGSYAAGTQTVKSPACFYFPENLACLVFGETNDAGDPASAIHIDADGSGGISFTPYDSSGTAGSTALTLGSSGQMTVPEQSAPSTPASGYGTFYIDTSDGVFKIKKDDGSVTSLEGSGDGSVVQTGDNGDTWEVGYFTEVLDLPDGNTRVDSSGTVDAGACQVSAQSYMVTASDGTGNHQAKVNRGVGTAGEYGPCPDNATGAINPIPAGSTSDPIDRNNTTYNTIRTTAQVVSSSPGGSPFATPNNGQLRIAVTWINVQPPTG